MPDITKCTNEDCPLSKVCWRFNCPPSDFLQSYSWFEPNDKGECSEFIEPQKEPNKKIKK